VAMSPAHLFKPQQAYRVKWNVNRDTPLPPEEPGGKNPPDGAIINYYLKTPATAAVTLEIFDAQDKLVRRYSSEDKPAKVDENALTIPSYWIRPPQILSGKAGSHRFIWDLRYVGGGGGKFGGGYSMAAIYKDTPSTQGPMVLPGEYKVKLTVDGKTYMEPLTVKMDPRVKTSVEELKKQFDSSAELWTALQKAEAALEQLRELQAKLQKARAGVKGQLADAIKAVEDKATSLVGSAHDEMTFDGLRAEMAEQLDELQQTDTAPNQQTMEACHELMESLGTLMNKWEQFKQSDLEALRGQLRQAKLPPL
jgi:hypothetical protein